jgi:hypothetical protein
MMPPLAIAAVAINEGRNSWRGDTCCTAPPLDGGDAERCHENCCA